MDKHHRRLTIYQSLHTQAQAIYKSDGVSGIAQCFTSAMTSMEEDEDFTFMRLTVCIRAEGFPQPTPEFISALLALVKKRKIKMTRERALMFQGMVRQICADLCQELISQAIDSSVSLSKVLGVAIDDIVDCGPKVHPEWHTSLSMHHPSALLH